MVTAFIPCPDAFGIGACPKIRRSEKRVVVSYTLESFCKLHLTFFVREKRPNFMTEVRENLLFENIQKFE